MKHYWSRVKLKWVQVTWTLCTHTEYTLWKIMGNNSSSLPEYWLSPPLWSAPVPQSHLKVISQFIFKPVDTLFLTRAFESTINYWSTWPMTYRGGWAQLSLIGVLLTMFLQTKTLNKLHQRWHLLLWNGHHYILIWVVVFFVFFKLLSPLFIQTLFTHHDWKSAKAYFARIGSKHILMSRQITNNLYINYKLTTTAIAF